MGQDLKAARVAGEWRIIDYEPPASSISSEHLLELASTEVLRFLFLVNNQTSQAKFSRSHGL